MIVYQNDPALPRWFRKYGCFLRSLIRIGEREGGRDLGPEEMLALHDRLTQFGLVRTDVDEPDLSTGWYCYILDAGAALNEILRWFDAPKRARIIGERVFLKTATRPISWGAQMGDYAIIDGAMGDGDRRQFGFRSHFRLEADGEIWDPHDPPIHIAAEINRRFIRITEG